ncbi:probable cytochrome P450 304a1 [Zophobas morio]|uniref:probable cytochrome P450 304a1 n=1 Tax=Zophobas morio TaxID=2755281 RepID=UPI0030834DE9
MLSFAVLFLTFVLLLIFYLYIKAKERPNNFPPGPPRLPIWGSYWFMLKENYNFAHLALEALGKRYKTDILGVFLGDFPTVVTFSHELCKELLTRDEFTGRNDTIVTRTRSMEEKRGIFFVDGPFWKGQRWFSLRYMRDFGFGRRSEVLENSIADEIKYLLNLLDKEPDATDRDICKGRGHVLVPDIFYGPLLNSIFSILASTRFDYYELRECARAGLRFQRSGDATGAALSMTPWLRFIAPDFFGYTSVIKDNGHLLDFVRKIVDEHLETFSDDYHRDFIDVFISESTKEGQFDYKQLLMIVLDYMFPPPIAIGHTLSFYFAYIINNPHVQTKIQEEIDSIVGRQRLPNLDDRKFMPYLEASIREAVRIFPLNPLSIPRRCVQDTYLGGYFIPENTIMIPCIWTAHKDERIWENPEEFKPERFLDEDGNLLKKDNTIGFGAGKRLCAGETFARHYMFLIVASFLQNYTIQTPTGEAVKFDIIPGINLSLKENWIKAVPR